MTLIDWSDPEAMLGLLIEYVDDEAVSTRNDAERPGFLHQLSRDLLTAAEQGLDAPDQIARSLREIHDSQPREFANDAVMVHGKRASRKSLALRGEFSGRTRLGDGEV